MPKVGERWRFNDEPKNKDYWGTVTKTTEKHAWLRFDSGGGHEGDGIAYSLSLFSDGMFKRIGKVAPLPYVNA